LAEGCDAEALLATAQKSAFNVGQERLGAYRLGGGWQSRTYLAVEAPVSEAIRWQNPAADKVLLLSLMDWNDEFSAELSERMNLSEAQLRVARGLLEGLTAQEKFRRTWPQRRDYPQPYQGAATKDWRTAAD
jgi:hypothetical protein